MASLLLSRLLLAVSAVLLVLPDRAAATDLPPETSAASVVMYHRFGEDTVPSTNVRIEQLEEHIALLTSGPYTVLPLAEVVEALRAGKPLPPRTVAITVDDAYRSFAEEGWPRFRAAGLPVTWFVDTAAIGRGPGAPTWDDVRRLRDEGVEIAAHSHAHPHLPTLAPEEQEADMDRSLALFAQELGARPTLFAYPYGEADAAALALAARKGFRAAFGQHSGVAWAGDDPWYLPRFSLNERFGTIDRFRQAVDALPLRAADVEPTDPVVAPGVATFAFTAAEEVNLAGVTCFGAEGALDVERAGRRLAAAVPVQEGRNRVNCTVAGEHPESGHKGFRWRGTQVLVLPDAR